MTLYEYLEKNWDNAAIDHSLRVVRCGGGEIEFYIHPSGKDGDTPFFVLQSRMTTSRLTSRMTEDVVLPKDGTQEI